MASPPLTRNRMDWQLRLSLRLQRLHDGPALHGVVAGRIDGPDAADVALHRHLLRHS